MIERERSAALPSPRDALEQSLLFALRAADVPEPEREYHFMWCCEHPRSAHWLTGVGGIGPPVCSLCLGHSGHHAYHRDRDFRFDLAWPDRRLAVEVDGGTYSGGRHTRGAGYERDAEKGNEAAIKGWRVLHVTAAMVEDGRALDYVERLLGVRG